VREFGADKPVVGDLVMEKEEEAVAAVPVPAALAPAKTEEEEAANDTMDVDGSERA
jgi:hypothetical protein